MDGAPKRPCEDAGSATKRAREDGISELLDQAETTGNCAPVVQWVGRNPFGIALPLNPLWKSKDLIVRRLPALCEKALSGASPSSPSVEGVYDVIYGLLNRGGYATEIADKYSLVEARAHEVIYKCIENLASKKDAAGSSNLDINHLLCLLRMHEFTDFFDDYTEKKTSFWSKNYISLLMQYAPLLYPKIGQELTHSQWEALQTWVGSFVQLLGKFVVFWGVPPQGSVRLLTEIINMGLIDILTTSVECILHFDRIHGLHISAKVRGDLLEEIMRVASVLTTGILDEIDDEGKLEEVKACGRKMVPILLNLLKCKVPTFHTAYSEEGKRPNRSSSSFSSPQEDRQQEPTWISELCDKCDVDGSSLIKEASSMLADIYAETADLPIEERRYRFDCTAFLLSHFLMMRDVSEAMRKGGYKETRDILCAILKADGAALDERVELVLFELTTPNFIRYLEQAVSSTGDAVQALSGVLDSVAEAQGVVLASKMEGTSSLPASKADGEATVLQVSTGETNERTASATSPAKRDAANEETIASPTKSGSGKASAGVKTATAGAETPIAEGERLLAYAQTGAFSSGVAAAQAAMNSAQDAVAVALIAVPSSENSASTFLARTAEVLDTTSANCTRLTAILGIGASDTGVHSGTGMVGSDTALGVGDTADAGVGVGDMGTPDSGGPVEAKDKMHKWELQRMIPLGAHILDFEAKRSYLQMRFERHRNDCHEGEVVRLVVPRDNVTDGVCDALGIGNRPDGVAASRIDVPLEIEFRAGYRNEQGEEMVEEGEDQGGLRRQWLDRASRHFIQSNLFCQPEENPHRAQQNKAGESLVGRIFTPSSVAVCKMVQDDWESQFELFGCVVGFALLYRELIPVHFSHSFLKQVFCKDNSFHDHLAEVECMDKMLYQKMKYILNGEYKSFSTLEEALEFSNLPTTFAVAESHCPELVGVTELCFYGSQMKVTEENKEKFVELFLRQYLVRSMEPQTAAFRCGLTRVVPHEQVGLMSQILTVREIELMLCGTDKLDIDDWQAHTVYENGYTEDSDQIKWFWEVVRSWDLSLCLELLSFTTGSSQVPTGGFHYLQPEQFTIQRVAETNRMVEAHTCANVLDLPMFESKGKLEKMLVMTLKEGGDAFGRR